jgi:PKD repeat protein
MSKLKTSVFFFSFIVTCVILISLPITATTPLRVQMYNGNTAAQINTIFPWFKITNTGSVPVNLADVKIRYYYTIDGEKPQNFWCDWSNIGSGNVTGTFVKLETPLNGADYYFELGFKPGAGSLKPGKSVEAQNRFAKSDWSNYDQTDDYSFNPNAKTYADGDKITVHIGGDSITDPGLPPESEEMTEVYQEDFSKHNNLSHLGFSGQTSSYWKVDSNDNYMYTNLPGGVARKAEIYSPMFSVNRDNGMISIEWKFKFLTDHHLAALINCSEWEQNRLVVSLADTNGSPLYSLMTRPVWGQNGIDYVKMEFCKKQNATLIPLRQENINKNCSVSTWFKVKMQLEPTTAGGGDGLIKIYLDNGDGSGYSRCLDVQDETHYSFAKLCFSYQTDTPSIKYQVAVDNIKVTEDVARNFLVNSGFENSFDGWFASPDWTHCQKEYYQGKQAAVCYFPRYGNVDLCQGYDFKQNIAGEKFLASAWVKTKDITILTVRLAWKNAQNQWIEESDYPVAVSGTNYWSRILIEGTAPLGATQVWLRIEPGERKKKGIVWVDECGLRHKPRPNLLLNSGFEAGFQNWIASPAWSIKTSQSYRGQKAAYCLVPLNGEASLAQGRNYYREISGIEFAASVWLKSPNATQTEIRIGWKNAVNEWIAVDRPSLIVSPGNEWEEFKLRDIAPSGATQAWLIIKPVINNGIGEFEVDELRLEESARPNLLINPGFENGLKQWSYQGIWTVDENTTRSGARSIMLDIPSNGTVSLSQGCDYQRDISGIRFLMSAWVQTKAMTGVIVQMAWKDNGGNWIHKNEEQICITGTNEWTQVFLDGIAPSGATQVWFMVLPKSGKDEGTVWIDGCSLEPANILEVEAIPGGEPIKMEINSHFNLPSRIVSYEWDINGDGVIDSIDEKPVYIFPAEGDYRINLTATDQNGTKYVTSKFIRIIRSFDIAVSWSIETGFALQILSGSGGAPVSAIWDFGDGTIMTTNDLTVVHPYRIAGTYQVLVRATDSLGYTANAKLTVEAPASVEAAPSVAVQVENGVLTAQFSANTTVHYGGTITSVEWDFGDGAAGQGMETEHVYHNAGTFTPSVRITDSFGHQYLFMLDPLTVENPLQLEFTLPDLEVFQDLLTIYAKAVYQGEVQSIAILVDNVEQIAIPGGKEVDFTLDTYLLANGSHTVTAKVIFTDSESIEETRIITVNNSLYRLRIEMLK